MYKELLAYNQTPERTSSIMVDEASACHKGLLYQEVFPQDISWYSSNAKTEAADTLLMLILLCEQKNWTLAELENIGAERFRKRMEELRRGSQE